MFNTTAWNRLRYTAYAPFYDAVAASAFRRPRRIALGQVDWEPGMRVLLVGAGTGLDLPFLPHDIEVHATDIAPAMVKRTAKRAEALRRDVECGVMDAEALSYPDEHFDVVVMHLILAVMPDPQRGLAEANRVLKVGGQLCVMDKFQPDAQLAGVGRRTLNLFTSALATDITRQAQSLLSEAGFQIRHDEPVLMNGLFRALLAAKPAPSSR
ncbi:MAG: methyltransferase domain-containing protein [Gammaproteobacteria bacterium]|uniref:Methyltransferase domain-containing protein n=1 Tax=Vreelandella titanicae TaxID=664683 RepID=A0A558JBV0_9GAMM|nr:methyltransferase domain-containing protein [Halomonas titanicae]MBR9902509.1 methyltransferase domain-containing protein [Gammaproteobacteria bacterium]TVU91119.1 methyltransferase domain-containing protein [Halomonas titanicae]